MGARFVLTVMILVLILIAQPVVAGVAHEAGVDGALEHHRYGLLEQILQGLARGAVAELDPVADDETMDARRPQIFGSAASLVERHRTDSGRRRVEIRELCPVRKLRDDLEP